MTFKKKFNKAIRSWKFWMIAINSALILVVLFIILSGTLTTPVITENLSNKYTDQMCLKLGYKPVDSKVFITLDQKSNEFKELVISCDGQEKVII